MLSYIIYASSYIIYRYRQTLEIENARYDFPCILPTLPIIIYVYSVSYVDVIEINILLIILLGVMSFIIYLLIISR